MKRNNTARLQIDQTILSDTCFFILAINEKFPYLAQMNIIFLFAKHGNYKPNQESRELIWCVYTALLPNK